MENKSTTLKELDYDYKPMSFRDSLLLSKLSKSMNVGDFIEMYIDKVTTLDVRKIKELPLQDCFTIMFMYLVEQFDNPEVFDGVHAKDFVFQELQEDEQITTYRKTRFSNIITLEQFKSAEKYCYLKGDIDLLGMYILSECCLKSRVIGKELLLDADTTQDLKDTVKLLNYLFGNASMCKVDLLHDISKIGFVTKDNQFAEFSTEFFF